MLRNILFVMFFCFCSVAKAQNTFEKVIDTLGSAGAACIQETFDGGYVYCGSTTVGGNHILVNKIDSVGTIEWVKPYVGAGSDIATYIEQTPDSGYILTGTYDIGPNSKAWLLKLDANGDTLWTKTFSAGVGATAKNEGNSMASYNNAIYGLTGYFKTPFPIKVHAYFIGTLNNGTLLATKLYDTSAYGTEGNAINKTNNGFIIGGATTPDGFTTDSYLIRTNAYGDTIWTKSYDYSQNDVIRAVEQTNDGGFILGGFVANVNIGNQQNIFLVKTDSNGDTLWTKFYWQNFVEGFYALQQTTDGGFILTGYTTDTLTQTNALLLMKTDLLGNIEWKKLFGQGGTQAVLGTYVKQTKDGGYIICGLNNNANPFGTYLIKTDSLGNVLTGLDEPELNNRINLMVFPNPANEVITVWAKNIISKKSTLAIYNLTGQCVYNDKIANNETRKIDVRNLSGGIYTLMLTSGNERMVKKIAVYK